MVRKWTLSLGIGILLIASCSRASDYEKSLPNGYRLIRTNAVTTAILDPNEAWPAPHPSGVAVAAKVVRIAVSNNLVVGYVESSVDSELAKFQVPGYFILDTQTGAVHLGLSESDWNKQLKVMGIGVVKLREPRSLP